MARNVESHNNLRGGGGVGYFRNDADSLQAHYRILKPSIARWLSRDPLFYPMFNGELLQTTVVPQRDGVPIIQEWYGGPNQGYGPFEEVMLYPYVGNNPLRYIDPTGLISLPDWSDLEIKYICCFVNCFSGVDPCQIYDIVTNWSKMKNLPNTGVKIAWSAFLSQLESRGPVAAAQWFITQARHDAFVMLASLGKHADQATVAFLKADLKNLEHMSVVAGKASPAISAAQICYCTGYCYAHTQ